MTSAARRWSNHTGGDKVSEAIVWCVEWRKLGNRAAPICHDHFFAGLDAIDVLAETILQFPNPDLRPRSSHVHAISVATSMPLSTRSSSLHPTARTHACQHRPEAAQGEQYGTSGLGSVLQIARRTASVAASDVCTNADLVALRVPEHGDRRGLVGGHDRAARSNGGVDSLLDDFGRHS